MKTGPLQPGETVEHRRNGRRGVVMEGQHDAYSALGRTTCISVQYEDDTAPVEVHPSRVRRVS